MADGQIKRWKRNE